MNDATFEKMTFLAFTDNTFKNAVSGLDKYTVQINPDSFSRSLSATWNTDQKRDSKNAEGKFAGFGAEKYSFKIVFDGTGIVDGTTDIQSKINGFLDVVYKVPANKDSKNSERGAYVKMFYCGETFNCVVDTISINYTLFSTKGLPLRAKLDCSFSSVAEAKPESSKTKSSPKRNSNANSCLPTNCEVVCVCSSDPSMMVNQAKESDFDSIHPDQNICTQ